MLCFDCTRIFLILLRKNVGNFEVYTFFATLLPVQRPAHIAAFTETILDWFERHKRVLPWRDLQIEDDTQRAYLVLVPEIMLQQTQVPRVEVVFKRFIREFPSLEALAAASNREIILVWRGMGYNSRALRLRDAAKIIVHDLKQVFPQKMEELLLIKGIGHYTAAAIRNFAFNLPTPCLDTNIRRILHRTFVGPENADGKWKRDDKYLLKLAEEVLEVAIAQPQRVMLRRSEATSRSTTRETQCDGSRRSAPHHDTLLRDARNWHAALMDFGSLVQTKINPKWDICPLTKRGLMKTTRKNFERRRVILSSSKETRKKEPGREIAGKFIPNRIIRGRIVEELRDAAAGLPFNDIGNRVCIDWNRKEHEEWLQGILEKLKRDVLIRSSGKKFVLAD